MPKPAFFRLLEPADRALLDDELRRRGYGSLQCVCDGMATRGIRIGKSALGSYAKKLKQRDDASAELGATPLTLQNPLTRADLIMEGLLDFADDLGLLLLGNPCAQAALAQSAAPSGSSRTRFASRPHRRNLAPMTAVFTQDPAAVRKMRTQDAVAADLLAGRSVDSVSVAARHSCWRLSSIIYRLRRRGWPITTKRDHGAGLARYSVPEGWKPPC
ncbi:MAG: helix-turn-helix domain-containing protein [Candidatus Competibacteraceae bacterium]